MQASSTYSSSEARRHPILVNLTLLVKRRLTPNPLLTRVRRESDKARRGVNPDTERKIVLSTWRKKGGGGDKGMGVPHLGTWERECKLPWRKAGLLKSSR